MKNRSRKTILAELNETVSNVPIRGTDEEKASSRMSREDILSGLTSMAGGGAETSSAINDAYAERTARRRAAQATNYNGVLQNYNALLDQMNENVSAYRHGRLQNRAGQAAADMNNATIGKYNEIEAGAQELLDGIGRRGLSASDRLDLEKALQELIAAAGENRTAAEQELAALYDPKTGKLLESVPDREWSSAVQERPQDAARWAQMDARAYSRKAEEARRNGNPIYNRYGYEVSRRSPEADEYERRAEEAKQRAAEAQQYQAAQRQAQQEAAVAENPAAYMRWAQMEANAYQRKMDETEYDWTNAREREAHTEAYDDWTRRRDEALAAYDRAYAALQEQEAAAYKGALEAPAEPWKHYSEINDESRWIDTIRGRDLSATRLLGNTAAGDWLDENVAYANFLNENIANMATRAARMQPEAYMSEAQRQTYNYLAATKGEKAAEAYYARILPGLEEARAQETQRRTAELTEAHPYLMTGQSVAMGPGKIPAGVSDIAKAVTGQEINKNDVLHLPVQTQQTIRSVAPEVTDWTGNARIFGQDADAFLYGTITSALDSAYNMAIGSAVSGVASMAAGGLGAAQSTELTASMVSALMGAEMLPETVMAEKEKGRDDAQAVAIGIIRSLIEAVTEKYSIEAFLGDPRGAAKVLGKAFVAEGSEEVASNWLNRIVDIVAADPEGITAQYQALREQGKSKAAALTEVLGGMLGEDAGSFLAGGLSGLAMSGTSYAVGSHVQNAQMGQYYQGDAQALVDEALQLDPQNRLAQRMDAQLAEGKNVRSAQLGRLAAQNEEQIAQAAQRDQQAQQTTTETAQAAREPARRAAPAAQQAETGARQYGAQGTETAAAGAQAARQETESRTRKSGKGGVSLLGTDVTRVTNIGAYDMEVLRADGTKEKLSAIDQRGTALEILQHAQEMPEYRDTVTVNGMLRSYEAFLNGRVSTPGMASGFYERYAAAVAAGAEGESRTAALSGITSRRLQDAISNAWQRGTEIEKGRRIAAGMGSAGSAAIARYGYLYPELFRTFYQAGQQGASFQQAMQAAGAKSFGETKKAEMTAAWKAGRKDGTDYEVERYAVSDASGQRENGMGAGGKAGGMEEGTGGSEGREGGRVGRRGGGDAENRTSLKELGVRSGTDAPQEVVAREKNEYGGEIITVSDRLLVRGQNGMEREVQAIQSGNNVILRADDPMLEQHKAHEMEHIRQRSMTDEEITAVFREKTKSLSDERLRRILSAYALDYYGLYGADDTTVADLYREYLADEAAGIRHKETDQDVILPGEQTEMTDRRGEAYAMRGNQNQDYFTRDKFSISSQVPQSSAEYAQMQRQQAQQQRTLQAESVKNTFALRQQFTEGTERNVSATELPDIAAELRRIYGRNAMSQTELQQRLEEIAMEKARADYPMEAYQKAKDAADALAAEMIRNASGQTEEAKKDWDGIRAAMRPDGKPVKLFIDGANRARLGDEGGYEGMRKRMMGYAFLSSGGIPVNEFYETLSGKFPDFFPDTLTEQADQLTQIAQVIDRFRQIFRSPYAGDLAADTEMLSQDILQRLYNSRQPGANEAAYAEQHEDMLRAYYETRMQNARSEHRQQVEQMREDYARRKQQQQTKREEQTLRQKLLKISQRLDRIRVGNEWYDAARALIGELDTVAVRMTGKTIVGDQIGNVSSEGIETTGETKEGKKIVTLEALREFVNRMKAENPDFLAGRDVMQRIERLEKTPIDSLEIGEVRRLLNAMSELENEMRTHNKLIKSEEKREIAVLAAEVRSNIAASEGVKPASAEKLLSDYITTNSLSPVRFLRRVTGYMESDPLYRAGIELQRGETAMLDYQRRAEARFRSFQEDKAFMASLSGKNSKPIEITARTDHGIKTVKITPDMRIAIYLHSRNNDNVRHAMYGGMIVPDYRLLMKGKTEEAYTVGTHIYLTRSQMLEIADGMSAKERNYANAIEQYYNAFSKEEINAVSRELRGYDIAVVRHYYPIEVNRNFVSADPETVKHDAKVDSSGFLKGRTGAANTINLRGATETLTRSIEKHSKYVGLAIPIRNFGKLYGNSEWHIACDERDDGYVTPKKTENDEEQKLIVSSVQEILQRKWGAEAGKYVDELMADLQNPPSQKKNLTKVLSKVRSNYAGAVLTLNLSVAMKQAASYPTAAAVVGWKALGKAMPYLAPGVNVNLDTVAKYTPLLWYRSKGYSTKELGDLAKGNRSLPKALNWIQAIDVDTTQALWKAAEYYVRDNQKGLTIGSEDYYRAVAEVYDRIILETQPNYTTMERPRILRDNDSLIQNVIMFKTQPMQNLNIAYDAIANLRAKERQLKAMQEAAGTDPAAAEQLKAAQQAVTDAKKGMSNGISALVVSAAVFAGMTLLWNFMRGKMKKYKNDEDEMTAASFMKGFGGDMLSSFAGMVPFGTELYEFIWSLFTKDTYYGMDALVPSALSDVAKAALKLPDSLDDIRRAFSKGDVPVGDIVWSINEFLTAATKIIAPAGIPIPAENVENVIKMVFYWGTRTMPKNERDYWYRYYTAKTSASGRRKNDYADIYAAALAGNMDGYSEMRGKMEEWIWKENDNYEDGNLTREEAKSAAVDTLNSAMKTRIRDDFVAGSMDEEKAVEMLTSIAGMYDDKAQEDVLHWSCERDTGIKYDDLKDEYFKGSITAETAAKYLEKYGGMDAEKADENLQKWACERDTGIRYDDLKSAYESGDISADAAAKYLETYGGKDAGEAEDTVQKWQYAQESGNADASAARAGKYYDFAEPAGINISVFDEAYTFADGAEADKDKDGKSISGSAKQKVVDYIKSLDLTAAQKEALWNAVKGTWSDKDTPWA